VHHHLLAPSSQVRRSSASPGLCSKPCKGCYAMQRMLVSCHTVNESVCQANRQQQLQSR